MDPFSLLGLGLVGPLVASFIAACIGKWKGANTVIQSIFAISSVCTGVAAVLFLTSSGQPTIFGYAGVPTAFFLDGLSAFFLILISIGTFLASIFALGYLPKYAKTYHFPSLNAVSGLFLFGMQAVVLAHSVLGFLLFWEVMSVAAYFLVIADREEASIKAGFLYFVMTHLGFVCLFAGFLLLAHGDASVAISSLSSGILPPIAAAIAFFLLFAGFGSKAGLVPLHQWLPQAHPQAPSHSSALMSGVMLKVAVYGFLRIVFAAFPVIPLSWAIIVTVVGLISAFFGVVSAAVTIDLKRLLAWSSIENLGLIFAMIGMGLVFNALGLDGMPFMVAALFHSLNHTIFKSGLFMAAGSVISETHTRDLDQMGGLANAWPAFSGAFLGLALAAAALPPLGTFYGEWLFLQSLANGMLLASSHVTVFLISAVLSVTALVGGLAIFTFAKTFSAIFLSKPRSEHAAQVKPLAATLVWPIGIASVMSLAVGIFATPIVGQLAGVFGFRIQGASVTASVPLLVAGGAIVPISIFLLIVLFGVIVVLLRRFATSRRPVRITDTWDCGQPITARMEYTATGFSAPMRFFFRFFVLAQKKLVTERVTPGNAWVLRRRLEWSTKSIWNEWVYLPITRAIEAAAARIKRLQNGVIQFYILLILITLVIVLVFAV